MTAEYVEDVPGSDSLQVIWGSDRLRGWYQTQKFNSTEHINLKDDITYKINIFDFQYRFIIPARVEFCQGINSDGKIEYGIIDYSLAERLLGVFRYPLSKGGFFAAPVRSEKLDKNFLNLSEEELKDLINDKKVVTFEAFRVPFYGFKYPYMTSNDFKEIKILAGDSISNSVRDTYEKTMAQNTAIVKEKNRDKS